MTIENIYTNINANYQLVRAKFSDEQIELFLRKLLDTQLIKQICINFARNNKLEVKQYTNMLADIALCLEFTRLYECCIELINETSLEELINPRTFREFSNEYRRINTEIRNYFK